MSIRCLIVDDEPFAIDLIEDFVKKVPYLSISGKCYDAVEVLNFLQSNTVDAIFLDINLPHLSGLELATILKSKAQIIFTTAYPDYAVRSYEQNAVDYLLKPITFDRFVLAVSKLKFNKPEPNTPTRNDASSSLFVKSGKKIVQIDLIDVTHIEGMRDYVIFHYNEEKIIVSKTLKELEQLLPEFMQRVHFSFFVNLKQIQKIEDNHIQVSKASIPISNKYRHDLMGKIYKTML
jgi:DNA-binding LytR/AlgR family response regulator